MQSTFPPAYDRLDPKAKRAIESVVSILVADAESLSLVWGGSTTLSDAPDAWADVDLWLVVKDHVRAVKQRLRNCCTSLPDIRLVQDAGWLPWLGDLLSLFFFPGCKFSVDVGVITCDDLATANPGSSACVIWGETAEVLSRLRPIRYERASEARLSSVIVNMLKVQKNLVRGRLWNAVEYIARARREVMGLYFAYAPVQGHYYSRPDFRPEEVLSPSELAAFAKSAPAYSAQSIAEAAVVLADLCQDWATRHSPDWLLNADLRGMRDFFDEFSGSRR